MNANFLNWTVKDGEKEMRAGVCLNDVFQWIFQDETLFLLTREQKTELAPQQVPVIKGKKVETELQIRNLTDFFTIKINDKEAINSFFAWLETQSV